MEATGQDSPSVPLHNLLLQLLIFWEAKTLPLISCTQCLLWQAATAIERQKNSFSVVGLEMGWKWDWFGVED